MAAAIVRNFFNEIRPSLEEELKQEAQKVNLTEKEDDLSADDEAEAEQEDSATERSVTYRSPTPQSIRLG